MPYDYNLCELGLLKRNYIAKTPYISESYNLFITTYILKTKVYELYANIEKKISILDKNEKYFLSIRRDDE